MENELIECYTGLYENILMSRRFIKLLDFLDDFARWLGRISLIQQNIYLNDSIRILS